MFPRERYVDVRHAHRMKMILVPLGALCKRLIRPHLSVLDCDTSSIEGDFPPLNPASAEYLVRTIPGAKIRVTNQQWPCIAASLTGGRVSNPKFLRRKKFSRQRDSQAAANDAQKRCTIIDFRPTTVRKQLVNNTVRRLRTSSHFPYMKTSLRNPRKANIGITPRTVFGLSAVGTRVLEI